MTEHWTSYHQVEVISSNSHGLFTCFYFGRIFYSLCFFFCNFLLLFGCPVVYINKHSSFTAIKGYKAINSRCNLWFGTTCSWNLLRLYGNFLSSYASPPPSAPLYLPLYHSNECVSCQKQISSPITIIIDWLFCVIKGIK